MPAHQYPQLIELVRTHRLQPQRLIGERVTLEAAGERLARMDTVAHGGLTLIALDDSGAAEPTS
jgi:hypothetical protein